MERQVLEETIVDRIQIGTLSQYLNQNFRKRLIRINVYEDDVFHSVRNIRTADGITQFTQYLYDGLGVKKIHIIVFEFNSDT